MPTTSPPLAVTMPLLRAMLIFAISQLELRVIIAAGIGAVAAVIRRKGACTVGVWCLPSAVCRGCICWMYLYKAHRYIYIYIYIQTPETRLQSGQNQAPGGTRSSLLGKHPTCHPALHSAPSQRSITFDWVDSFDAHASHDV